ncbi:hypothetical protein ACIF6L_34590 [Kitasatospora sp. NPDC086009]|uniref:hypothetical protein n=1 Tax=unclassified Kitasatospora TaxID=2633591 RepID=UPI002E34C1EF|nr:hypothetical protein [Kitasatospora sp. NBC_01246]
MSTAGEQAAARFRAALALTGCSWPTVAASAWPAGPDGVPLVDLGHGPAPLLDQLSAWIEQHADPAHP